MGWGESGMSVGNSGHGIVGETEGYQAQAWGIFVRAMMVEPESQGGRGVTGGQRWSGVDKQPEQDRRVWGPPARGRGWGGEWIGWSVTGWADLKG